MRALSSPHQSCNKNCFGIIGVSNLVVPESTICWEVLNGVGVDGVGVISPFLRSFPFFYAFFPFFFAFLCFS